MSDRSWHSNKEDEETERIAEVEEEREDRLVTSPNPQQPSLMVDTLLVEMSQQLQRQAEQTQRMQVEQSRD